MNCWIYSVNFFKKNIVACAVFIILAYIASDAKSFDWESIEIHDTLSLYVQNRRVGVLIYAISFDSVRQIVIVKKSIKVGAKAENVRTIDGGTNIEEIWEYNIDGKVRAARQVLKSPTGTTKWKLVKLDDRWKLSVSNAGIKQNREIENIACNLRTTYTIYSAILNKRASKGDSWIDTTFDMMSGKEVIVKTTCVDTPKDSGGVWTFVNKDNVINKKERWEVNGQGETVLMEVKPIFTAKKKNRKNALMHGRLAKIREIAEGFIVGASRGPEPHELIILDFNGEQMPHESVSAMYCSINGEYVLLPMPRKCREGRQETVEKSLSRWLRQTASVQTKSKPIRELAKRLKDSLNNTCKIVNEFNNYVFTHIEKRNVATFSNAVETLNSKTGDCGEHAVLLTALLRSVGIPSRIVYGMVYIGIKKGYMYHAWVQVYTAGTQWINADPALGVFPAWNGYIPLVVDDTGENTIFICNVIDRIKIKYASEDILGLKN